MSTRDIGTRIRSRFRRFGISASASQIQQLCAYFGLLAKWNTTVNLTSLELEPASDKTIDRLFVEPFLAARVAATAAASKTPRAVSSRSQPVHAHAPTLLDIGSGGGSPAIPLKVALPEVRLRMVEAKARKSAFLREAVRRIPLANVEVLNARLEELLAEPDLHESADLVSIRAVRADQRLWNTVSAFSRPGAVVLWFRSHADRSQDTVFFPAFLLESVESLVPAEGSELAILRKPV